LTTQMNCELSVSPAIGVTTIKPYSPCTGLTPARMLGTSTADADVIKQLQNGSHSRGNIGRSGCHQHTT
jgi:hypothetical protein